MGYCIYFLSIRGNHSEGDRARNYADRSDVRIEAKANAGDLGIEGW